MKKIAIARRNLLLLLLIIFGIFACKKENLPPISYSDYISNQTIRYTVLVVPAGNAGFKSFPNNTDTAFVSLAMNGKIITVAADKNGLATFNNLAAGNAAVTVRYPNHCTANLIVDLRARADTLIDNNNLRNASTIVALFPYSGPGTATVSGKIQADLDLTISGLENGPANLKVYSIIDPSQYLNFVKQEGDGEIKTLVYEHIINQTNTLANGDFTFSVPAAGSGLKLILTADDFVYDQVVSPGVNQRKIFRPNADTITTFSGFNHMADLKFN